MIEEKIAAILYNFEHHSVLEYEWEEIKHFPKRTKEWYNKAAQIIQAFRNEGWVQLAEDQSLPEYPHEDVHGYGYTKEALVKKIQQDMLKQDFKRVILPGE